MNSSFDNPYASPITAAQAAPAERVGFIRRTYAHLAGAIAIFAALEFLLFQLITPEQVFGLLGASQFSWLIVLGAFIGVSFLAERWANSDTSVGVQYFGLGLYIVAESLIFLPLLMMAEITAGVELIGQAGILTLFLFGGLSAIAFTTKKDFSFLGGMLKMAFFVALGLIVLATFTPMTLGIWFSGAMIIVAAASILYSTSNVIHHYRPTQHVAASLSLFASVALLFWYVLRFMMAFGRD